MSNRLDWYGFEVLEFGFGVRVRVRVRVGCGKIGIGIELGLEEKFGLGLIRFGLKLRDFLWDAGILDLMKTELYF